MIDADNNNACEAGFNRRYMNKNSIPSRKGKQKKAMIFVRGNLRRKMKGSIELWRKVVKGYKLIYTWTISFKYDRVHNNS